MNLAKALLDTLGVEVSHGELLVLTEAIDVLLMSQIAVINIPLRSLELLEWSGNAILLDDTTELIL